MANAGDANDDCKHTYQKCDHAAADDGNMINILSIEIYSGVTQVLQGCYEVWYRSLIRSLWVAWFLILRAHTDTHTHTHTHTLRVNNCISIV
jgi:hypothetical protein